MAVLPDLRRPEADLMPDQPCTCWIHYTLNGENRILHGPCHAVSTEALAAVQKELAAVKQMAAAPCPHEDTLTTTVELDPETDHRETMCCRCFRILCDEFLSTERISTGQSNALRIFHV